MNSRERVINAFNFKETDQPPCDLMEGRLWAEIIEYFKNTRNCRTEDEIIAKLDPDFRWTKMDTGWNRSWIGEEYIYGRAKGPLADFSFKDIVNMNFPEASWWQPWDYASQRDMFEDKAIVFWPGWLPLFWTACEAFGAEDALVKMLVEPEIFTVFIQRLHELTMQILTKGVKAAKGFCDVGLLGDDFASQESMLISPECWRKFIKPYLAEQARIIRENGMFVMYHSCGAVRPILHDLIEIGIDALLVFQTNARDMEVASIAKEFGGKLAFYGGIDVQYLLSFGTEEEIRSTVVKNIRAFESCGGYIVANSHHGVSTIKGKNIEIMLEEAKKYKFSKSGDRSKVERYC